MRALREGEGVEWHGGKAVGDQNLRLREAPVLDVEAAACGDWLGQGRLTLVREGERSWQGGIGHWLLVLGVRRRVAHGLLRVIDRRP